MRIYIHKIAVEACYNNDNGKSPWILILLSQNWKTLSQSTVTYAQQHLYLYLYVLLWTSVWIKCHKYRLWKRKTVVLCT